ncbi:hypothetical protein MOMA_02230 [Moraxella macacae 0408225]|uniref:DUF3592 domain-containing protein n=1 Tax=Moraxella macacae 0408225 TaxID=1230338 RepID=L2F8G5_9GAMM|nr:hypothetical protein [Moraxella macacae]ELA09185.1 hypothetical protein MOMA_02230 [Moraxella macacae 0408225]
MEIIANLFKLTIILLFIINVFKIIIDFIYILFPKKQAKIKLLRIHEEKNQHESFFCLNIIYEYEFKGEIINGSKLNSFNNIYRKKRSDLESIINKRSYNGYIDVYVNPFFPKKSYAFPLRWNKIFPISSIIISTVVFLILYFTSNL